MSDLQWNPVKIKLGQIIPWEYNPRMSTKAQAQRLIKSERELGTPQTLAVSPFTEDHRVHLYDGHQRTSAWLTVKDPSFEVWALQSNRPLTDDERKKISVLLHTATGSWSWDALSSWSAADLREWGLADKDTIKGWNNDANNATELLRADGELDNNYSRKIEAPIYEPRGDKPAIKDLFDNTRTTELIAEIEAADIPQDEKDFLKIAAQRHTVLNFKRIAEYYAHSPAPVQKLMEDSALVIIDFKRAIELGYVKLSEEIAAQYLKDYPNA